MLSTLYSLTEIVYCLDFAPNCTRIGKFSCASLGLCLSKSVFANQNERLSLNCTSVEGGLCQSNPCGNNGICYDGIGNFICGCKPGWKGQTCDTESKFTRTYYLRPGGTILKLVRNSLSYKGGKIFTMHTLVML